MFPTATSSYRVVVRGPENVCRVSDSGSAIAHEVVRSWAASVAVAATFAALLLGRRGQVLHLALEGADARVEGCRVAVLEPQVEVADDGDASGYEQIGRAHV